MYTVVKTLSLKPSLFLLPPPLVQAEALCPFYSGDRVYVL